MTFESFLPCFLILFLVAGVGVFLQVNLFLRKQKVLRQFSRELGFSPLIPGQELRQKIARLYEIPGTKSTFEFQNVFHKVLEDCDIYLFDLIETSGSENDVKERQAVAVVSSSLKLPHFILIPKLNSLLTAILKRSMARWGKLLDFPLFPTLNNRYMIISREAEAAQPFLNHYLAELFSKTKSNTLYACGDIFTFSEFHESNFIVDPETLGYRIHLAQEIFRKVRC